MNKITAADLKQHDPNNTGAILAVFAVLGIPSSLLDLGSGSGIMVNVARGMGIDAVGVDLLATEPDIKHDLSRPLNIGRGYSMIVSFETAEHLPEQSADIFCNSINSHLLPGGILVFTAAQTGQKGSGHINCQPRGYWQNKFTNLGMSYDGEKTNHLATVWRYTAGGLSAWLSPNLQVFKK